MTTNITQRTKPPVKAEYTVLEASQLTGLSVSRLRIWETRYGWPSPRRTAAGYRMFTQADIDQIKLVAEKVFAGALITDIVRDGHPVALDRRKSEDEQQALVFALHQQVALLREVVLMDPRRRFSDEGQRLAKIALNRSACVVEASRRRTAESKVSEQPTIDSPSTAESVPA